MITLPTIMIMPTRHPMPWDAVAAWMQMLRQTRGKDLLRVKGILYLQEETLPVAIHGVHHIFHPPVQLGSLPDDDRRSRIVFITRGLDQADVEESWLAFAGQAAAA